MAVKQPSVVKQLHSFIDDLKPKIETQVQNINDINLGGPHGEPVRTAITNNLISINTVLDNVKILLDSAYKMEQVNNAGSQIST